jgi:hypothetical protein
MTHYDRTLDDVGNIVSLEHVNTEIPDQQIATLFYVAGLGLTRDPYQMVSLNNMWVNAGRCQFHLPSGKPQVVHGTTAVVIPGRAALLKRLAHVKPQLAASSRSPSITTASRRCRRGATASASTSPAPASA